MKTFKLALALSALPLVAAAQDPVKVDPSHYKVLLDNPAVRVLKVNVAPGAKTPMHAHPDALLVPLESGKARFTMPDGKTEDALLTKETAAYTPAGTHAGANVGTTKVDAILVEFKTAAPGTATVPTGRAGLQQTILVESPRAIAFKTTAAPDFQEPAGTTHDYDQVVIALGEADISLKVEGKAPVTKWHRGDVQFIGRGQKHESKNVGGKPLDYIIVAIR
jgi:quercetin dioxygenase-like cupin family protein